MTIDWRIYPKEYRDPTFRDVEDRAEEIGATVWKTTVRDPSTGVSVRSYWLQEEGVSGPELLQRVPAGIRPNWAEMLKRLEADWV